MNKDEYEKFAHDDEHNYLDRVDRDLYSRNRKPFQDVRIKLSKPDAKTFDWEKSAAASKNVFGVTSEVIANTGQKAKRGFSFFALGLFIFSLVLFFASAGYAFFKLYSGQTSLKHADIVMSLDIPGFTNSGQMMNGQLTVQNNNAVGFMESFVSLDVKNPVSGDMQNLMQVEVGEVAARGTFIKNVDLSLSGREGESREVVTTLFYKVAGSQSTFQKVLSKEVKIQKSQAIINMSGPRTMSLGQVSEYRISVRGGINEIPGVGVKLDLPKDMKIIESSIDQIAKGVYPLGTLKQGEERIITIKAVFQERKELADTFSLKSSVGVLSDTDLREVFADTVIPIALRSTPFSITIESEKQSNTNIYFAEKKPKIKITVKNDSSDPLRNGVFVLKLSGGLLNQKAVSVGNAVYDAGTGIVKATAETNDDLKEILPGGSVTFDLQLQDTKQTNLNASRKVVLDATFSADIPDTAVSPATVKKVTTLLPRDNTLATLKLYYFSGPFKNIGVMPPKVGVKNTYTIVAGVETYGGFTGGTYTVTLPPYVEYIKTDSKDVSYNRGTREVVWNIGTITPQDTTLININKREAAFQVSIIPSPDQVRQSPRLTKGAQFKATAIDKTDLDSTVADLDLNFSQDPQYEFSKGYGNVVE